MGYSEKYDALLKSWHDLVPRDSLHGLRRRVVTTEVVSQHKRPARIYMLECGHSVPADPGLKRAIWQDCPFCWLERASTILTKAATGASHEEISSGLEIPKYAVGLTVRHLRDRFYRGELNDGRFRPRTEPEIAKVAKFYRVSSMTVIKLMPAGFFDLESE